MQGHTKNQNNKKGPNKKVTGIIEITRRGTGFLPMPASDSAKMRDKAEDVEIDNENLHGALNGDEVEVEITGMKLPSGRKSLTATIRPHGRVLRVIKRTREEFVCTLKENANQIIAVPDDFRFYRPIQIQGAAPRRHLGSDHSPQGVALAQAAHKLPNSARTAPEFYEGKKALVRLISFDGKTDPKGEIISLLGKAGEHRTEMNAIVIERGFSTTFPADVAREAQEIEKNHATIIAKEAAAARKPDFLRSDLEESELRSDLGNPATRIDFREITTFTIDPLTAKDFDDALSIRELDGDTYEIGVHIADVSYFVRPGTALEAEAQKRGTSVYLVDATIPMLPEELSGNVCSLRPHEDRLAFSAIFTINKKAEVLARRFARTIIRSDKRFTYEEAQEILDADKGVAFRIKASPLSAELVVLRDLSRIMRREREKEGAIDFGDHEVKFELDATGKTLSITRKERIETNLLIEEFMLLANREVAAFVSDLAKKVPESKLAFVYRIHDEPKEDRIEELATFVRAVGYEFGKAGKARTTVSARDIQKLLTDIKGTPEETLIRTATLRSMAKAIYSTKNIGHFGLAFKYYTHFTSPIRRYPDVLVHRILSTHLTGGPINRDEYVQLEKLCLAASLQEAKAADAERDSIKYKQVEYLADKIGQEFDGVISGVVEWGLYVEEKNTAADGLVRVSSIADDYYNYAPKAYALVGERKHKKYALGDTVRVRLVSADLIQRQLEFVLV